MNVRLKAELETPIVDIMSSPIQVLSPNMTLDKVDDLFRKHGINHAPVVNEKGEPIGVVSSTDISRITHWRAFFQPAMYERKVDDIRKALLVEEIMRSPAICISSTSTVAMAARLINERRFHSLPVTDKDGKAIGMVTAHDLLRLLVG